MLPSSRQISKVIVGVNTRKNGCWNLRFKRYNERSAGLKLTLTTLRGGNMNLRVGGMGVFAPWRLLFVVCFFCDLWYWGYYMTTRSYGILNRHLSCAKWWHARGVPSAYIGWYWSHLGVHWMFWLKIRMGLRCGSLCSQIWYLRITIFWDGM